MCFVWISEQTAIISLYSINWQVCITETECVNCAVRTEHLTFNNSTLCPHCIYVFCIYLRTNSDLCHLQHKLIGFYNRSGEFLQRGTHWGPCITEVRLVLHGIIPFLSNTRKYGIKLWKFNKQIKCKKYWYQRKKYEGSLSHQRVQNTSK